MRAWLNERSHLLHKQLEGTDFLIYWWAIPQRPLRLPPLPPMIHIMCSLICPMKLTPHTVNLAQARRREVVHHTNFLVQQAHMRGTTCSQPRHSRFTAPCGA